MARGDIDGSERTAREAYYARLFDEQEARGLSVAAFAEEEGLSVATLYSWRRRLGRAASKSTAAALIEVSVHDDESAAEGADGRMSVVTTTGRRIEVPRDFDEVALARLLVALERC